MTYFTTADTLASSEDISRGQTYGPTSIYQEIDDWCQSIPFPSGLPSLPLTPPDTASDCSSTLEFPDMTSSWSTGHVSEHSTYMPEGNLANGWYQDRVSAQTAPSSTEYPATWTDVPGDVNLGLSPVSYECQTSHSSFPTADASMMPPNLDLSFLDTPWSAHENFGMPEQQAAYGFYSPPPSEGSYATTHVPVQDLAFEPTASFVQDGLAVPSQQSLRPYVPLHGARASVSSGGIAQGSDGVHVHSKDSPASVPATSPVAHRSVPTFSPSLVPQVGTSRFPMATFPDDSVISAPSFVMDLPKARESDEYLDGRLRSHPLYSAKPGDDGYFRCPYEDKEPLCGHKATKLKCNYDKYIDSHLKPFRCKFDACSKQEFSSTACLLRHEREAHGLHGHGERPHLCFYPGCERGVQGSGFPRRYNLYDHMKRVHDHREELVPKNESAKAAGRKRKAAPAPSDALPAKIARSSFQSGKAQDQSPAQSGTWATQPEHGIKVEYFQHPSPEVNHLQSWTPNMPNLHVAQQARRG